MTSRSLAILFLVISAALWSTSGAILKSLPGVHWVAIAGVRSLFAALVFLPGLARPRPPAARLLPAVLLYALLVTTLMGAMQLGTAAQGIWLQYVAPAIVALWAWRVQRQRLLPAETLAVVLAVLAVVLIIAGGRGASHLHSVALGIISGFAFAFFILLLKTMADSPPSAIHFWTNLGTAAILLPLALALHIKLPAAPRDWLLLAIMGMAQLGLPYYFFQRGLAGTRAVEASLIILLEPILNPIWTYFFAGEVPSGRVVTGCALIALGLVAFALSPGRREPPAAAPG